MVLLHSNLTEGSNERWMPRRLCQFKCHKNNTVNRQRLVKDVSICGLFQWTAVYFGLACFLFLSSSSACSFQFLLWVVPSPPCPPCTAPATLWVKSPGCKHQRKPVAHVAEQLFHTPCPFLQNPRGFWETEATLHSNTSLLILSFSPFGLRAENNCFKYEPKCLNPG